MTKQDIIEMAQEAGPLISTPFDVWCERFAELVRADEREHGQKWFDAVTAQHKQEILAEREACAKVAEDKGAMVQVILNVTSQPIAIAAAIRARAVGDRAYDRYEGEIT